jgi:hypothetical protein
MLPRFVAVFARGQQVIFNRRASKRERPQMFNGELVMCARRISERDSAEIAISWFGSHGVALNRWRAWLRRSDVTRQLGAFAEFAVTVQP